MKIRGIIGGLISSVSAGDFSFLLSDYSSSQAETSLVKSEDSEIVVPNVSSELSRLFPFVRNRLPFLIVLAVRLKKLLKVNKLFADFVESPFGKVCISKIDQFIDGNVVEFSFPTIKLNRLSHVQRRHFIKKLPLRAQSKK